VTEQQARHYNVVVRGVRQSDKEDSIERMADDGRAVGKVFAIALESTKKQMNEMLLPSIKSVRRLGRREEGKDYRPLLVRVGDADLREMLLRNNKRTGAAS
jgi:hypothetical protein